MKKIDWSKQSVVAVVLQVSLSVLTLMLILPLFFLSVSPTRDLNIGNPPNTTHSTYSPGFLYAASSVVTFVTYFSYRNCLSFHHKLFLSLLLCYAQLILGLCGSVLQLFSDTLVLLFIDCDTNSQFNELLDYANSTRAAAGAITLVWFLTLLSFTNFFGKALQKKYYFPESSMSTAPKLSVALPQTTLKRIFKPVTMGIYFIICLGLTTFGFALGGKMKFVIGTVSIIVVMVVSLFVFQHVYVLISNDRRHHVINELQILFAIAYMVVASMTCTVNRIVPIYNLSTPDSLESSLLTPSIIFGVFHSIAVSVSAYFLYRFLQVETGQEGEALLGTRNQIQGVLNKKSSFGDRRSTKAQLTYSSLEEMFEAHGLTKLVPVFQENDIDIVAFSFMELEDLDALKYQFTVGQKLKLGALITRGFDDFVMI